MTPAAFDAPDALDVKRMQVSLAFIYAEEPAAVVFTIFIGVEIVIVALETQVVLSPCACLIVPGTLQNKVVA